MRWIIYNGIYSKQNSQVISNLSLSWCQINISMSHVAGCMPLACF